MEEQAYVAVVEAALSSQTFTRLLKHMDYVILAIQAKKVQQSTQCRHKCWGMMVVKYGVTRHFVLGFEVFCQLRKICEVFNWL